MHTKRGSPCEYPHTLSCEFFKFVGYAFVDNTDLIQSSLLSDSKEATALLQQALDTWEHNLKVTCGAIILEKTVWWLVNFHWSELKWQYESIAESLTELYVNNIQNERMKLKRLEPDQAYKTLGVYLAPDGNLSGQYEKLMSLAIGWADAMRTGTISKEDAWLALSSTIWRSLSYPLAALLLSKQQWEAIMSPILRFCLPAMGVCRNFPCSLVFAESEYFGLGFKHLHTMQEIMRLKDIIGHTGLNSLTGQLYCTSLELFLLEVGAGDHLLSIPQQALLLATESLVCDSVLFLRTHSIHLQHDISLKFLRSNDQLIITALLSLDLTDKELYTCNHCRMYLQALFVSDIATNDGLELL
jgi:hypothetical protein